MVERRGFEPRPMYKHSQFKNKNYGITNHRQNHCRAPSQKRSITENRQPMGDRGICLRDTRAISKEVPLPNQRPRPSEEHQPATGRRGNGVYRHRRSREQRALVQQHQRIPCRQGTTRRTATCTTDTSCTCASRSTTNTACPTGTRLGWIAILS